MNTDANGGAIVKRESVSIGGRGIILESMDGLVRFATAVSKSGLAPKGIETPEAIAVAIQMGLEVGLTPMAALQNIAVINGRPTIWGDAQLAICRSTGELEEIEEWYEVGGKRQPRNPQVFSDDATAVCRVKRRGFAAVEGGFSVADAKRANLWGKQGPWTQYPSRMLKFRARSFALRDQFGDALKGLLSAEEVADIQDPVAKARNVTPRSRTESQPVTISQPAEQEADEIPMNYPAEPVKPVEAPKAVEALTASATPPHDAIWAVVERVGMTFDVFLEWAISMGEIDGKITPTTVEELPKEFVEKWSGRLTALERALKVALKGVSK